jgi:hypothetical protein
MSSIVRAVAVAALAAIVITGPAYAGGIDLPTDEGFKAATACLDATMEKDAAYPAFNAVVNAIRAYHAPGSMSRDRGLELADLLNKATLTIAARIDVYGTACDLPIEDTAKAKAAQAARADALFLEIEADIRASAVDTIAPAERHRAHPHNLPKDKR